MVISILLRMYKPGYPYLQNKLRKTLIKMLFCEMTVEFRYSFSFLYIMLWFIHYDDVNPSPFKILFQDISTGIVINVSVKFNV